jgi:glycosyltransferase involved in cell wall biosynthesis
MKDTPTLTVNARFMTQRLTGVQRYALEMCQALEPHLTLRLFHPRRPIQTPVNAPTQPLGRFGGHLWEQTELGPQLAFERLSAVSRRTPEPLLWSPCNVGPVSIRQQIVTIHDLVSIRHPEWVSRQFHLYYQTLLPLLAKRVRHVVTISEHSKMTIVDTLGIPDSNVTVIPNGISKQFTRASDEAIAEVSTRYDLPETFMLSLGSLEPRKNLLGLLDAWLHLPENDRVPLIIAGGVGEKGVFGRFDKETLEHAGVRWLGYIPDDDLPALLSAATLFAYVSLEEGFGLPPLEALACATPVVTSDHSALRENCAGEAVLVNPTDKDSIAAGLQQALEQEPLEVRLARAERLKARFNWQQSAAQLVELIQHHIH